MSRFTAPLMTGLTLAALMLIGLHIWASQGPEWVLLDGDDRLLSRHADLGSCWSAGESLPSPAFECRRL